MSTGPIHPLNLTLVGMPGSGKSTVGRALAQRLGWTFLDLDERIEQFAGRKLWQIVDEEGFEGLARREESAGATLEAAHTVIAPGGSIVYFEAAMRNLKRLGPVLYLQVPPEEVERRAGDLKQRGVLIRAGMSFRDLIAERDPLYRAWADLVIECGHNSTTQVVDRICDALEKNLRQK